MTAIGEITVLDDHAPLLTSIKPSTLYVVYKDEHGLEKREDFYEEIYRFSIKLSNMEFNPVMKHTKVI